MSYLKLNRLQVIKEGSPVFDEVFHNGINIIRGHNSTGKSTISNFIFFALGGEFVDWLPEAASCDFVIAELEINGALITIKRDIENTQRRPMSIFIGELEKATVSIYEGWHIYPYNKSDITESFSQLLFKALDFPEISTENQESITINQILRLLYVDQLSSLDSLMRNEDFDSPLIRSAIGNLLLGTYNDDLLRIQIELRKKEREYNDVKKQVKALEDVFENSPFEFDNNSIHNSINEKKLQLEKVLKALREPETISASVKKSDTKNEINKLKNELLKYKERYDITLNRIYNAKAGILDNNEFIDVLNSKLSAINESLNSREILGNFPIQYCPVCLEKIDEIIEANHCKLCKKEVKEDIGKSKLLRMKLEVEMQVKESTNILKAKEYSLETYILSIKETERELQKAQMTYDVFIHQTRSSLETKYDKLLEQKGKLVGEIEFLEKQLQLISAYGEYKTQLYSLESAKGRLTDSIEKYKKIQFKKASTAYSTIQKYALELLKGDGVYEEKFQDGRKVTVDFGRNTFYLDDRNRFSASSLVLLKNCVRFAIFFASVELDYFRYPRFILCDNIEDKGMEEARSRNFQKNIASLANSELFIDKKFQIIMTTSMIADELNVDSYTIGGYYNSGKKSLDI
jgi:hypothetical protein